MPKFVRLLSRTVHFGNYNLMTLFSHLWRQCSKESKPSENFFSEIVAELFKTHPEFLFKWLEDLGVDLTLWVEPEIVSQAFFRSEDDDLGFYDIFIRLRHDNGEHLIVIESKIDTMARCGQLQNIRMN